MRLPDPELTRLLQGFALLLHSGIGPADSAFLLAREESASLQTLLNSLGEAMDQGGSLSEALEQSGAFPVYVCAMVHVGEETGRLEEALNSLTEYYEKYSRTLRYIQSALAYPALVFMLMQLSTVLRTVVSQQLLPDVSGGMVPACEILKMNNAVRNMIRDNKNHQIDSVIASGSREGMISMDQAIAALCRTGKISRETALHYAGQPEQMKRLIQ